MMKEHGRLRPAVCLALTVLCCWTWHDVNAWSSSYGRSPRFTRLKSMSTSVQSTTTASSSSFDTHITLKSVELEQQVILDGAEWMSIQRHLKQTGLWNSTATETTSTNKVVATTITIGIGSTDKGDRMMGFLSDQNQLVVDSAVQIPKGITNPQAVRTLHHAWAAVHCLLPTVTGIGGATADSSMLVGAENNKDWKVVVVGSNDHAVTSAKALAALGCQVYLVAPSPGKFRNLKSITVLDSKQDDFSTKIQKFDALLDTVGNELSTGEFGIGTSNSIVTNLLSSRHKCHVYVSTRTAQQDILEKAGILGGPKQADQYLAELDQAIKRSSPSPPPSRQLGTTVQKLLDAGIIWPEVAAPMKNSPNRNKAPWMRGWTLAEYWESTTWPRSAEGNVRFGFPSFNEEEEEEEEEDDEPVPLTGNAAKQAQLQEYFKAQRSVSEESKNNPDILFFSGVRGLKERVMEPNLDGVLFLAAPYCRTCRYLKPQYQRMARFYKSSAHTGVNQVVFCKADAVGDVGKELGKYLGVDSVPTFVLFKKGQVYGTPLSISRLPSEELNRAIAHLEAGLEWDGAAILGDSSSDPSRNSVNDNEENMDTNSTTTAVSSRTKLY